jgi:dephospho-CoA kinase
MLVIGITGTLGAGKGTIVDFLTNSKGFKHLSVREFIIKEIEKQGLPVNRDSMVIVANKLRSDNSPSFIIDQLYDQALASGKNCIIESIRTPGEVKSLREKGNFYLFAVDADPLTRYNRIYKRQSETDNISFATFLENEEREMHSTDPNHQNIMACMNSADFIFNNDGTLEQLVSSVEETIEIIIQKDLA